MKKKNKQREWFIAGLATLSILFSSLEVAAEKVVVIPLMGSAPGDAVVSDVIKGKTFSGKAGKGLTGTLVGHPMGQTHITPWYLMTFNLIPSGTFTMGSPANEPGHEIDEEPQVTTTISQPFYMMVNEITQWQWQAVVLAAEYWGHIGVDVLDDAPSHFKESGGGIKPDYPVEMVSYNDIQMWIGLLNTLEARAGCDDTDIHAACYRLPTEAEWEYAARAGTTTAYANQYNFDPNETETGLGFNANLAAMGWYHWNDTNSGYQTGTKPTMRKQSNAWGIYDMHSNIMEWCRDWYDAYYYASNPLQRPTADPEGLPTGSRRVIRGGTWNDDATYARSADRYSYSPSSRNVILGFRLVLPPNQ